MPDSAIAQTQSGLRTAFGCVTGRCRCRQNRSTSLSRSLRGPDSTSSICDPNSQPNTKRSPPIRNCLYWSFHTTAGFLDRSLAARLSAQHIPTYVEAFRTLFPEGAGYEHDRLERRGDLDSAQRAIEPRNADSHLAFIASGLRTCVTHPNRPGEPVYFVDLDGVNDGRPRRRRRAFIGFTRERVVGTTRIEVPVSGTRSTRST